MDIDINELKHTTLFKSVPEKYHSQLLEEVEHFCCMPTSIFYGSPIGFSNVSLCTSLVGSFIWKDSYNGPNFWGSVWEEIEYEE